MRAELKMVLVQALFKERQRSLYYINGVLPRKLLNSLKSFFTKTAADYTLDQDVFQPPNANKRSGRE